MSFRCVEAGLIGPGGGQESGRAGVGARGAHGGGSQGLTAGVTRPYGN